MAPPPYLHGIIITKASNITHMATKSFSSDRFISKSDQYLKSWEIRGKVAIKEGLLDLEPLPPDEEKQLKETLQEIIGHGKKVKLEQKIDPSILGGLVVEFSQKVFDMPIRTRARQMGRFLRDPINFDSI